MFKEMNNKELKAYIKGCRKAKEYDSYFDAACCEANNRGFYDQIRIEVNRVDSIPFRGMAYNREI